MKKYCRSYEIMLLIVTMALVPKSYATSYGTNIVTNGDAETGDLTGWTASGVNASSLMIAEAYFGENVQALHGKVLELYNSTPNIEGTLSQVIDIADIQSEIAAGSVSASLSVQAFSWYGATASYSITEMDASGNVLNVATSGTLSLLGQSVNYHSTDSSLCMWTTTSVKISRLNVGTKKLTVSIYGRTSNIAEDFVDFDNVQLVLSALPTVATTSVTTYGKNSATMGGNVSAEKGASVTQRGVVYSSTATMPTVGGTGVTQDANGSGTGGFSESIASLSAGTTYYVRSYAINAVGTSYGSVVSFTTLASPSINGVLAPNNDTYIVGEFLDYTVSFSENVFVTGSPHLNLTVGSTVRTAVYVSGSGSAAIKFRYTVVAGESDLDGVALASNITLNGGTIKDAANNGASVNFAGSTAPSVKVDGVAPTISGDVTTPSANTYAFDTDLDYTVNFSENVFVTGSPYLNLTVGSTVRTAVYVSGSGSAAIKFRYTVVAGESDLDGVALASNITLNGGTIKDVAGNNAAATFTGSSAANVLVDAIIPSISSVAPPSDATYTSGDTLAFTASFSEVVNVTGTPSIALTIGGSTIQAVYASGSGTSALKFYYVVSAGDVDSNGIAVATSVALSGGTIKDTAGNPAMLTFAALSTSGVLVDALAPSVLVVIPPDNDTYVAGENLDFAVVFNEDVTVIGSPYISLTVGGSTVQAVLNSGSGSDTLVFRYTVASGNSDGDGVGVGAGVVSNGATVRDAAGNNATLTFFGNTSTDIRVDAVAPVVSSVMIPAAHTYNPGDSLWFMISFDDFVFVSGVPHLRLTIGSTTALAKYVSGDGSKDLKFCYVVQSGDEDLDGIGISPSIETNDGSIKDSVGNAVDLALGTLDASQIFLYSPATLTRPQENIHLAYALTYDAAMNVMHVQLPSITQNAEIQLLDLAGRQIASYPIHISGIHSSVTMPQGLHWNLVILRVNGIVKSTWRGISNR